MTVVKIRKPFENEVVFNSPFSGLMDNFFGNPFFAKGHASFVPAVNISEEETKFSIEVSAPGFDKTDFKVEVDKGMLSVSAEHKNESNVKEKNYTRKEFNYGSFKRSFSLPEGINEEAIDAKYENGVLNISLPKKEKEKQSGSKTIVIS